MGAELVLHVLRRELRANARSLFAWAVPLSLMLVAVVSLYPTMVRDGDLLAARMAVLPLSARRALGLTLTDFRAPSSYLAMNFLYVTLCGSLWPALLGAGLVAREETQRTAEMLYAQPVRRSTILLGKALAAGVYTAALHLLLWGVTAVSVALVVQGPGEPARVASLFGASALRGLCFAGVGMLLASLAPNARHATGLALGAVLGAFLLRALGALSSGGGALGWLSPFRLLDPAETARSGLSGPHALALVLAGALCAALALWRYERRDVHA